MIEPPGTLPEPDRSGLREASSGTGPALLPEEGSRPWKALLCLVLFSLSVLGLLGVMLRPAPVVVALWFEASGSGTGLGRSVEQAVLQALDYRNHAATWRVPYRFVPLVVSGLPKEEALSRIAASGALAVLGGATSSHTERIAALLTVRGIPCISPTANSPRLARTGDLLYRYTGSSGGEEAGTVARRRGGFSRYVAVLDRDNPVYAWPQMEAFARGLGIPPRRVLGVEGAEDLPRVLRTLKEEPLDGVLFLLPAFLTGIYAQRIAEVHPKMVLWTSDWGVSGQSAALAGPGGHRLLSGVFFPVRFPDPDHPFLVFLRERYGALLDPSVLDPAYGAVALLEQAMELGGATPKGMVRGLHALRQVRGLTGTFPVDEAGDVQLPLTPVTLRGGHWMPLEDR